MDLTDRYGLNDSERIERLSFLEFTEQDSKALQSIHPIAQLHADELIDRLYEHLLEFPSTRAFFRNPQVLERVKQYQKEYFIQLTEGKTDRAYFENRLRVGDVHQRIELLPQWYLGLYSKYFGLIIEQLRKYEGDPRALEVIPSLMKLIFLDIGLAIDAYIRGGFVDKLRAEQKVSEGLREELARKERLAILGQLSAGVGHELRNPMAAMGASVYYLRMAIKTDDQKIQKHLGRLEHELNTANEIIGNLLDFSRVRKPEITEIALARLVDDALENLRLDNVDLSREVSDTTVAVDPIQIRQVLNNLITNALQAMPAGGRLKIQAGNLGAESYIAVQDDGVGIEADVLDKIFQPLFTTKAKGIGLGLSVCETFVRNNGGRMTVASKPGEGSTFTIFMPTANGGA